MSLYDELAKIGQQVKSQLPQMQNNESATVHVSVMPFIRALGYNTQDLSEIYPEYSILNMDAVDYAVLRDGEPIMFLEAKKASENLSAKHWKQLFEYFNADKARIGILTNGVEYRFYTDSVKQNIMDEGPFMTLDILNLDASQTNILEGFSKSRFSPDQTLRKIKISNLLDKELNHPSDEFVKHFAKQVHAGAVWQTVIQEYRPLVKRAWGELVDQEIARRVRRFEATEDGTGKLPLATDVEKPDSQESNVDSGDIPVIGYYEEFRFEAELLRETMDRELHFARHHIRYNGKTTWLKNAAIMAIRSVDPKFEPTRTYPNGFKFWHVVDPVDGKEHMLSLISGWDNITDEALRQRVLNKT